jgi:hypothetical protein
MGRQKPRKKNDFYPTIDHRAADALAAHLEPGTVYAEPCAGVGDLIHLLEQRGFVCDWGLELEGPSECRRNFWPIGKGNALNLTHRDLGAATCFITNPPWSRGSLHALILHLARIAPTWLLFDASWMHTQQAMRFAGICTDVVSVGRLKFFRESRYDPPDDCAWYRFDAVNPAPTRFHWRTAGGVEAMREQLVLL